MSSREEIKKIDNQISGLRTELIRIIAQINFTIGSDKRAILSAQYKQLKQEYLTKKEEIYTLRTMKDVLATKFSYLHS